MMLVLFLPEDAELLQADISVFTAVKQSTNQQTVYRLRDFSQSIKCLHELQTLFCHAEMGGHCLGVGYGKGLVDG